MARPQLELVIRVEPEQKRPDLLINSRDQTGKFGCRRAREEESCVSSCRAWISLVGQAVVQRTMLAPLTKATQCIGDASKHSQVVKRPRQLIIRIESAEETARWLARAKKLAHWTQQRVGNLHNVLGTPVTSGRE